MTLYHSGAPADVTRTWLVYRDRFLDGWALVRDHGVLDLAGRCARCKSEPPCEALQHGEWLTSLYAAWAPTGFRIPTGSEPAPRVLVRPYVRHHHARRSI
ncbi:hypothetical protein [Actinoplanes sp. URMC 104]|uniref:hypothetical protein n=1 Tax=Actinoplanes sp. URMC 104 TaxID=3423409 RepID=UPI003F199FE0